MKIDLHVHSACSDGTLNAREIMAAAKQSNVDLVSICDADNFDCLNEAVIAAAESGIACVPGVSMGAWYEPEQMIVHLNGYYFNPNDNALVGMVERIRSDAQENVKRRIAALQKENIDISEERLKRFVREKYPNYPKKELSSIVIRQYIEKYLNLEAAAGQYVYGVLSKHKVKLIPYPEYTLVIEALKHSGARIVISHPGYYEAKWDKNMHQIEMMMERMIDLGVEGVEAYSPYNTPYQQEYYSSWAKKRKLLITAGSDFQGMRDSETRIGEGPCPDWLINDLKAKFFKQTL